MSGCIKHLPLQEVSVSGTVETDFVGPALVLDSGVVATTPGTPQTIISETVPVGETWRLRRYRFVSRAYATFRATIDGTEFESGKTSPTNPDLGDNILIWAIATEGQVIEVEFDQPTGPGNPITETEARLYYTKE